MKINTFLVCVLAVGTAVLCLPTHADIYQYKDKDGNVVFSDKPPADDSGSEVEEVELGVINSSQPPPYIPPAPVSGSPSKTGPGSAAPSPARATAAPFQWGPGILQ